MAAISGTTLLVGLGSNIANVVATSATTTGNTVNSSGIAITGNTVLTVATALLDAQFYDTTKGPVITRVTWG